MAVMEGGMVGLRHQNLSGEESQGHKKISSKC
jgi:hypothetical protein